MKRNLLTKMTMLLLGAGLLAACGNNEILDDKRQEEKGTTYMSVSISMPRSSNSRAGDGQNLNNPAYNYIGKWAGQDKIEKVEVYVFDATDNLEQKATFVEGEFDLQNSSDSQMNIKPLKGIKVLPGQKKVYVVINPTTESTALLANHTTFAAFESAYQGSLSTLASDPISPVTKTTAPVVKTVADKVAEIKTNKDVILMTANAVATVDALANVSEQTTITSIDKNRVQIKVQRAVARVMITTKAAEFIVNGDDILTQTKNVEIGKVKDIKYVVAQGEKAFYFQQKTGTTQELSFVTLGSDYVPTSTTFSQATTYYDYSGLWRNYNANNAINGVTVPTATLYSDVANTALENINAHLKQQLNGEFILPNTHKWGDDQSATGYRKGNTAYVLVRAQFRPKTVVMTDGTLSENYSYPENTDFYLGKNGVFYQSNEAARDANKKGVANQETTLYVKGKTLYYAWVNPDKTTIGWLNSPVLRNNIYHIEITGFKRIGANWNPLVPPADPNNPNDPNDPNNPDPRPNNPFEPTTPPVKPEDPLTPKETWMSVETVIIPWQVHSYSVVLGD